MYPRQIMEVIYGFVFSGESRFKPVMGKSSKWKHWVSVLSARTCLDCRSNHGKIYGYDDDDIDLLIPLHPNCECAILDMDTIEAGSATINGSAGADWRLKFIGRLPSNYISMGKAIRLGWVDILGNLAKVAPGKSIGGGVFYNDKLKLPNVPGRIWYEADINYTKGYRTKHRILYSNDGLLFVTYDHYETFYEII